MYLSNLNIQTKLSQIQGVTVVEEKANKRRGSKGFTLVEMLVVMAIIGALLGLGVGALKSVATSKGVSTALPLIEDMFAKARQIARSGVPTRVVIFADTTKGGSDKNDRYLKTMGIVTARDAAGNPVKDRKDIDQYKFVSRPLKLPRNTFFNENLSKMLGKTKERVYPGTNERKDCYSYIFNAEGALIDEKGDPVLDAQIVIQAGKLRPGETVPDVDRNARRDVGGFRIWPNGRMSMFRSPNQIIGDADEATFSPKKK